VISNDETWINVTAVAVGLFVSAVATIVFTHLAFRLRKWKIQNLSLLENFDTSVAELKETEY